MNKKTLLNIVILTSLFNTASANSNNNEWQINKLISPSFSELQAEFVFNEITCYQNIDPNIINKALDKHFERIQFMSFNDCHQEVK